MRSFATCTIQHIINCYWYAVEISTLRQIKIQRTQVVSTYSPLLQKIIYSCMAYQTITTVKHQDYGSPTNPYKFDESLQQWGKHQIVGIPSSCNLQHKHRICLKKRSFTINGILKYVKPLSAEEGDTERRGVRPLPVKYNT